jgi:hypothetical protein
VIVRSAEQRDLEPVGRIEDEADRILLDLLQPDDRAPAPSGAERAATAGLLLVAEQDVVVVEFAHVLEPDGICHVRSTSGSASRRSRSTTASTGPAPA